MKLSIIRQSQVDMTGRIVPQAVSMIVERLGRYSKTMEAGLHLLERHADGGSEAFTPESRRHVSVYCPA